MELELVGRILRHSGTFSCYFIVHFLALVSVCLELLFSLPLQGKRKDCRRLGPWSSLTIPRLRDHIHRPTHEPTARPSIFLRRVFCSVSVWVHIISVIPLLTQHQINIQILHNSATSFFIHQNACSISPSHNRQNLHLPLGSRMVSPVISSTNAENTRSRAV